MLKKAIKKNAPTFVLRWLRNKGLYHSYKPAVGKISMGDLERSTPFSTEFGYDRGGPVDRYYIENFLAAEAGWIKGRVLEIGDNAYTIRFGGGAVTQSDVLHVHEHNPQATFVGDLTDVPQIPDSTFDCIILTQTLHLIYDFRAALQTCHRILKPGGVLLLTAPGITPIDYGEWGDTWYWSFTEKSLKRLCAEAFPAAAVDVQTFGNVYAATAFLYGMGLPETDRQKLDFIDPQYPVTITVKAQKTPAY